MVVQDIQKLPLYEKLAAEIVSQIEAGTFQPGDRLPSVREISKQKKLSVSTIMQAYHMLEDRGTIEARPQSGYYVRSQRLPPLSAVDADTPIPTFDPEHVRVDSILRRVYNDMMNPNLVQLGAALPDPDLLPTERLNRILARLARSTNIPNNIVGLPEGSIELRTQVAQRVYTAGATLAPEDFIITAGCTEAIAISLEAVCRPGDLVAIESPTYFGILHALETLGLRALEIPTHHGDGMSIEALSFALEHHPVRAVVIVNYNNPLGSCMPVDNRKELVELLTRHDIPLLENDINGELFFDDQRPVVAKSFDRKGLVMLMSSFSKDISPAYRVGWLAGGRYRLEVERWKLATSISTSLLPQLAIAEFLDSGGYDHHLRKIRRVYAQKVAQMAHAVNRYFPAGTRVTSPEGGFVLWVQMPEKVDSLLLYQKALKAGITIVPGYLFSATPKYPNYIRLNAAYMSFSAERAIQRLGELTSDLVTGSI
jgi:DNA-binding transcriptional MocR family regulator